MDQASWRNVFRPPPASSADRRSVETHIEVDQGYAVLTVRFFDYGPLDSLQALLDPFFRELARGNIDHLILDLRGNDGGNADASAWLLSRLLGEPFRYFSRQSSFLMRDLKEVQTIPDHSFDGQLYVLIDGGCVSTTGHFCAHLKDKSDAIFIGERTGASGVCNGGFREYRLKNSGIRVQMPHTRFIADIDRPLPGHGIQPDEEILMTVADLLADHDPVMDKAKQLIDPKASSESPF